jgi:hypothetical protein
MSTCPKVTFKGVETLAPLMQIIYLQVFFSMFSLNPLLGYLTSARFGQHMIFSKLCFVNKKRLARLKSH